MRSPWGLLIPLAAIIVWPFFAIVQTIMRTRVRELEIRERIAMIEKGLVPPPEKDPGGFERAMSAMTVHGRVRDGGPARHRRTGVLLIGVGLGLVVMIGLAGHNGIQEALGIGGFLMVLGVTFLVISLFEAPKPAPTNATSPVEQEVNRPRRDPD
jgi:hypothetical protein